MNFGYLPVIPHKQILTTLLALVILSDYFIDGDISNESVKGVVKEEQRYYNPGGNSHFTFKLITETSRFYVDESNAEAFKPGAEVTLYSSWLFREINGYALPDAPKTRVGSIRLLTGLVIPVLVILVMVLSLKYEPKMAVLTFVMQVVLVGVFVLLLQ